MATLTLGQIVSRATEIAGGRLDWGLSDASFYANQAAGYIARTAGVQHRSLESSYATTITSGVSRMRIPTDYNFAVAISIGSTIVASGSTRWRTLGKRDIGGADAYAGRLDATTGQPEAYVEYGDTFFEMVPSPNSSYSLVLRYQRQPDSILTSTATFSLNDQWDWAIVLKTAELLAMSRTDIEMEQICRNRYIDYMSTLMPDQDKKWMDQRGSLSPPARSRSENSARL